MDELLNELRRVTGDIDSGKYNAYVKTEITVVSLLIILTKILEKVNGGDEELLEIFAAHLIEFTDRMNEDENSDEKMREFDKLNSLLDGLNL